MNRAILLGLVVGASAALTACDIPSATFGATSTDTSSNSTESAGGSGASTSAGGGGAHTVTHSATGGGGAGSGGGTGGSVGGAGGSVSTTSTTTTSSTTTTTWPGPIVPCGYPAKPEFDCAPTEWCCYDLELPYLDYCSSVACPTNYNTLECNTDADCPNKKCCGKSVDPIDPVIKSTYCKAACDPLDDEYRMCEFGNDCIGNENCYYVFQDFYVGYGYCK